MSLQVRGSAHNEANSSAALTVTKPAGVVDGDLLIAVASCDTNNAVHSADTGAWTEFAASAAQTTFESKAWWREASSEPSSWDFSHDVAANDYGVLVSAFYNDAGVGNWTQEDEQFSRVSSGNSQTTTAITGVADCLYFLSFFNDDNEDITSEPTGPTKLLEVGGPGAPDGTIASIALASYYEFRSAGDVTDSITWGGSAEELAAKAGIFTNALAGATITSVDSDYGALSDEFDVDENSLDVNGTTFEAVQGTGTVWLADETTLAASNAEVDLDAAINTWGDTEVNLNLNNLSAGDKTNVEALIVSDGHALFIILVNDTGDEASLPVTVHRAKAFAMSLSGNIAASGENTTGQLTAPTSGSFGGGRIQDDENPADTVNIGDDEYFEDEWCIEALANSVYDETYLFRVLIDGQPAGTITVTPGLTIEAAAAGIEILRRRLEHM